MKNLINLSLLLFSFNCFGYEQCNSFKINYDSSVAPGYLCSTRGVVWRVESPGVFDSFPTSHRSNVIVTDTSSGMKVELTREFTQYLEEAERRCRDRGARLLTSYPKSLNGVNNFPNVDSESEVLSSHGLEDLLGSSGILWASSPLPAGYPYPYNNLFKGVFAILIGSDPQPIEADKRWVDSNSNWNSYDILCIYP